MSYDVWLAIDTGRTCTADDGTEKPDPTEIWSSSYTSNCGPMWRKAGVDISDLDGMPAPLAAVKLTAAIEAMKADPDTYRAMNPANGWGDYDSCLSFLTEFRDACQVHRLTTVRVWA